jgi:hypothetical protein
MVESFSSNFSEIEALSVLSIGSHFFGCILEKGVEGINIRHHITIALSEIEEFLLLDDHDTLGDVQGAKCGPKLLPHESVIFGPRSSQIPPPSPRAS